LIAETVEDMTSSYTDPLLLKGRSLKQSPTIKDSGTNYYTTNQLENRTWENSETTFIITTETAIPHPDQETKTANQTLRQKQNPTKTKENNEQNQAQKMTPIDKSATHLLLSNHYKKFPHYEKPSQTLDHYLTKGLVSPYYRHQQLNALALLHLRRNNLHLHLLTWQQQLQLQQQWYNCLFKPRQLEPLPLSSLQQIKEYVTDFERLCKETREDHQQEDHPEDHQEEDPEEEVEAQGQSPPPLPKAPYRQLPPET